MNKENKVTSTMTNNSGIKISEKETIKAICLLESILKERNKWKIVPMVNYETKEITNSIIIHNATS